MFFKLLIPVVTTAALALLLRKRKQMNQQPLDTNKADVEVQLERLEDEIVQATELLNNVKLIQENLIKMHQRRNQLKLLVDIHRGKLRVHRNDTGEQVPVKFWA